MPSPKAEDDLSNIAVPQKETATLLLAGRRIETLCESHPETRQAEIMKLPEQDTEVLLFHNPNCSKSRAVHALLTDEGIAFEVRTYLDEPLDVAELAGLEERLGRPVAEWVRPREGAWADAGALPTGSREEVFAAVAAHPILMERPIVVRGTAARVGRPPESVLELFD